MKEIARRYKNLGVINFVSALLAAFITTMLLGVINNVFEMGIPKLGGVGAFIGLFVWCLWMACKTPAKNEP